MGSAAQKLILHVHVEAAGVTLKQIKPMLSLPVCHRGLDSSMYSAPGTLIIAVVPNVKIRKALRRLLRGCKLRCELLDALLRFDQLRYEASCLQVRVLDKIFGYRADTVFRLHAKWLPGQQTRRRCARKPRPTLTTIP
jgi:hypothetical protein